MDKSSETSVFDGDICGFADFIAFKAVLGDPVMLTVRSLPLPDEDDAVAASLNLARSLCKRSIENS